MSFSPSTVMVSTISAKDATFFLNSESAELMGLGFSLSINECSSAGFDFAGGMMFEILKCFLLKWICLHTKSQYRRSFSFLLKDWFIINSHWRWLLHLFFSTSPSYISSVYLLCIQFLVIPPPGISLSSRLCLNCSLSCCISFSLPLWVSARRLAR